MSYFESILYGMVQGLTEYLPISSSAHLILLPRFLNMKELGLTFDVFLHLGTLGSTLFYFRKDWLEVFQSIPIIRKIFGGGSNQKSDLWKMICVATLPALIMAALFHDFIESALRGNETIVATLTIGGILLYVSDRNKDSSKSLSLDLKYRDALWIGLFQCLALVPGMSRSGSTIMGARFLGYARTDAARFSFLISAPITAAAVLYELRNFETLFNQEVGLGPVVIAGLSSFLFGLIAIGGLLKLLKRFGFLSFAIYRIALAGVIWLLLVSG